MTSHFLIRDHKGNPYALTAENITEAIKQLDLKPRNCTAEVLDTSVPYQKWNDVERQELLNIGKILKVHNRIPSKDIHPFTRTLARQAKTNAEGFLPDKPSICVVCGTKLAVPTRKRGEPRRFCSSKCRVRHFRNGNN